MNRAFTPLIIILLLLAAGCEKDRDRAHEIRAGDCSGMMVQYYDTTIIGGYNSPEIFSIDIDSDGKHDIEFLSEVWGSPAMGQHPHSLIMCLHEDIQLMGMHTMDTSFLSRDTLYQEGPENSVEAYIYYRYTCHRILPGDSIIRIFPSFSLAALKRDDPVRVDDTFKPDTLTLLNDWSSLPPWPAGTSGDTIFYEYHVYENDCYTFPAQVPVYIGLKCGREDRLGWIRISIFDKFRIMVLESAIQE